jgi:hypothetical protein
MTAAAAAATHHLLPDTHEKSVVSTTTMPNFVFVAFVVFPRAKRRNGRKIRLLTAESAE